MVNKILKQYYIYNFIIVVLLSCYPPILIYYQGQLFNPEDLSKIFFLTSIVGIFQFILNKLPIKKSLFLSPILNIILSIVCLIILQYNIKYYILTSILVGAVFRAINIHTSFSIMEVLKNEVQLQKISNYMHSITSLGSVIGSGIAIYIIKIFPYITILKYLILIELFSYIGDLYINKQIWDFQKISKKKEE